MDARSLDAVFLGCTRKVAYGFHEARRVAKRMRRSHRERVIAEYHCNVCKQWHVGGDDERKLRGQQKRIREKQTNVSEFQGEDFEPCACQ
jgi:hypothetical protein